MGIFGGVNLPKSRLVLEIVTHYAAENGPLTLAKLKEIFPDELQGGTFGVVAPLPAAAPSNFKGHKRYYTDEAGILPDGPPAVCTQWRADNILKFIAHAECSCTVKKQATENKR